MVGALTRERDEIYRVSILPALEKAGIFVVGSAGLTDADREYVQTWFHAQLFPALTPLAVNPTHRFPFISNLSENLAVMIPGPRATHAGPRAAELAKAMPQRRAPQRANEGNDQATFARVKIPASMGNFLQLPTGHSVRFHAIADVVREHLRELFPGMPIAQSMGFRVTRSAGIQKDDLDTANLMLSIEADLKQRKFARVVRLEVESNPNQHMLQWLLDKLNVNPQDVYERAPGIDFAALSEIADLDRPELRHRPWKPVVPARLAETVKLNERTSASFFAAIRREDVLVHHPYESFQASVERFIAAAAADPDVLAIKQTLYRTTPDSPFIENLVRAAEAGKQVACLVELRARFDEDRNVRFARQLEKAGVHVAYGVMGLKTHCKTSLVVRKERAGLRCYAHIGTGNYHPKTAQLYTDVGLLTADPEITGDLVRVFNFLTGMSSAPRCETLLIAPYTMRPRVSAMIQREIEHARAGRPARIWAKLNAMEDHEVTADLYKASAAGVDVRLVVRGFCCLIPGVPGMSERIRVRSVVGRFLEHSRVYHFANSAEDASDGEWYISSADWMYRNLSNRIEVAVPVREQENRRRLERMFRVHFADGVNAWDLKSDGSYARARADMSANVDDPARVGTFETLMRDAAGS